VIVISGALVLVALVLLVLGVLGQDLALVYASIGVSVASLLSLLVGILQRRGEPLPGDGHPAVEQPVEQPVEPQVAQPGQPSDEQRELVGASVVKTGADRPAEDAGPLPEARSSVRVHGAAPEHEEPGPTLAGELLAPGGPVGTDLEHDDALDEAVPGEPREAGPDAADTDLDEPYADEVTLTHVPGSGYYLAEEQPEAVLRHMLRFLDGA